MQTGSYTIEDTGNGWMRLSLDIKLEEGERLRGSDSDDIARIMEDGRARWEAVSRAIYEELVENE